MGNLCLQSFARFIAAVASAPGQRKDNMLVCAVNATLSWLPCAESLIMCLLRCMVIYRCCAAPGPAAGCPAGGRH
jgi:hypothetical protein